MPGLVTAFLIMNQIEAVSAYPTNFGASLSLPSEIQNYYEKLPPWKDSARLGTEELDKRIKSLESLAQCYDDQEKYEDEERTILSYLLLMKCRPNYPPDKISDSYLKLGAVNYFMNRNEKALHYCREALEITKRTCDRDSLEMAVVLNNIGWIENEAKMYQQSEKDLRSSLKIIETKLGTKNVFYGMTANNLSTLYLETGDSSRAIEWCRRALAAFEKSLGPKHPLTIDLAKELHELQTSEKTPAAEKR